MTQDAPRGSVIDQVRAVWSRRKWLAVLTFAFPFTLAAGIVASLPNIYRSTVTVLIERQQVPEQFVRSTVTSALETRLQTISQEILSRARLQELIARFRLYLDLRGKVPEEAVTERMRQDIQLELRSAGGPRGPAGTTIAFALSYRGGDSQTVAQVANTLASFYIEENLKVRERQATGTAQFLKVQLDEVKKRLDQQEGRVSDFRRRSMGALPQQMDANLAALERLHLHLRLNSESQARAFGRRQAVAVQLRELAPAAGPGGGPDARAVRLARLRQELAELRTRFSDKYPDVIRVRTEIVDLERRAAQDGQDGKPPEPDGVVPPDPAVQRLRQALAEADAEIEALKREETHIRTAIVSYQRRVEETPRREQEFLEISRDYETTKTLYATLLQRYEEAQLAESMEQRQKGEQFRILDPALASQIPAAPNRPRLVLVGLFLALAFAAGAVVVAEQFDSSFHTLDDLRGASSVPVLASIPRILTVADTRRRRRRFRLATLAVLVGLALTASASYAVARGNERLVWALSAGRS